MTVVALASRQHWVVSAAQLYAIGMSKRQVTRRVQEGSLHRRHRGVYAVGRPQLTFAGDCVAALLACGPRAAISHRSAAAVWGIAGSGRAIHVTLPRGRAGHPGLLIHRPTSVSPADFVARDGIAVTTLARTMLDLATEAGVDQVGRLLHEAQVQRVLDVREIWAVVERHPYHRGTRTLIRALSLEVAPTRSGLEEAFIGLCRRAGLPSPRVNEHVWTAAGLEEVDFRWPEARLVVEVDGARYHSTAWRRRRDAEKTARLEAAGWRAHRFAELEMALAPIRVSAITAQLHGRGRSK